MNDNKDRYFEDNDIHDVVRRYQHLVGKKAHFYLDVHEFESVIDYFLENMRIDEATRALELACAQHPLSSEILFKKTRLLIDHQKYSQAKELLERLEALNPVNAEVFFLKGVISLLEKNEAQAQFFFSKALSLSYIDRNRVMLEIATCYEFNGYFSEAIGYFNHLISEEPENTDYLFDLADCYDNSDEHEASIACYERIIDIEPYNEFAWHNLGMVYFHLGNWEKAIESFDFSIVINDQYTPPYYSKADVYISSEEYFKAIRVYNEIIAIEGETAHNLCLIGECYEKLCFHQQATECFVRAIGINGKFPEAWYGFGINHRYLGNFEEALTSILVAIEIEPKNMHYQFALGEIYQVLGQKEKANRVFRSIIASDPYMPEAWIELASTYTETNINEAISIISDGLFFNHNNAILNYTLSSLCYHAGRYAMAYKHFEKGLSINFVQHNELLRKFPELASDFRITELLDKYNC